MSARNSIRHNSADLYSFVCWKRKKKKITRDWCHLNCSFVGIKLYLSGWWLAIESCLWLIQVSIALCYMSIHTCASNRSEWNTCEHTTTKADAWKKKKRILIKYARPLHITAANWIIHHVWGSSGPRRIALGRTRWASCEHWPNTLASCGRPDRWGEEEEEEEGLTTGQAAVPWGVVGGDGKGGLLQVGGTWRRGGASVGCGIGIQPWESVPCESYSKTRLQSCWILHEPSRGLYGALQQPLKATSTIETLSVLSTLLHMTALHVSCLVTKNVVKEIA